MNLSWKRAFPPGEGSLFDIRVYNTNERDQDQLLAMLVSRYQVRYMEEGIEKDGIPDYSEITDREMIANKFIKIDVFGVQVNCHFFTVEEMALDLLPEDINSPEKADAIFELMRLIAIVLKKRVLLTFENASATEEWAEKHALCGVDPSDNKLVIYPPASHY
jgi:hypothetical protein